MQLLFNRGSALDFWFCAGNILRLWKVWRELPEPKTLRKIFKRADNPAADAFVTCYKYTLELVPRLAKENLR